MKVQRIYLDSSVFGGCFDEREGWAEASNRLIDSFQQNVRVALVGEMTFVELSAAPPRVRDLYRRLRATEFVRTDAEIRAFAGRLVEGGAIPSSEPGDALHVAAATCRAADLLVSWNFKHIVNWSRIRKIAAVSIAEGYRPVEIRTPQEVIEG